MPSDLAVTSDNTAIVELFGSLFVQHHTLTANFTLTLHRCSVVQDYVVFSASGQPPVTSDSLRR